MVNRVGAHPTAAEEAVYINIMPLEAKSSTCKSGSSIISHNSTIPINSQGVTVLPPPVSSADAVARMSPLALALKITRMMTLRQQENAAGVAAAADVYLPTSRSLLDFDRVHVLKKQPTTTVESGNRATKTMAERKKIRKIKRKRTTIKNNNKSQKNGNASKKSSSNATIDDNDDNDDTVAMVVEEEEDDDDEEEDGEENDLEDKEEEEEEAIGDLTDFTPRLFSMINYPRAYRFKELAPRASRTYLPPAPTNQSGSANSSRRRGHAGGDRKQLEVWSLNYKIPQVPIAPPENTYFSGEGQRTPVYSELVERFSSQPIWAKDALVATLRGRYSFNVISKHINCVAYRFSKGPWSQLYIRYGYDPRSNPSSRELQHVRFTIPRDIAPRYKDYIQRHFPKKSNSN